MDVNERTRYLTHRHSFPPYNARRTGVNVADLGPLTVMSIDSSNTSITSSSSSQDIEEIQCCSSSYYRHDPNEYSMWMHESILISPLTEDNLKIHTEMHYSPSSTKFGWIESFVESQIEILILEAELERRRWADIRSLIPLDTQSLDDGVIQDTFPIAENDQPNTSSCKRQRKKSHWLRSLIHRKPRSDRPSPPPVAGSTRLEKRPSMGSFDQYQQEKARLIQYGLCGFPRSKRSSDNTTSSSTQHSLASLLFAEACQQTMVTEWPSSPSPPTTPKRDSGISLFAALSSSASLRWSRRCRRYNETSKHGGSSSSSSSLSSTSQFLAIRYPKLVRMHALRAAAIQILSTNAKHAHYATSHACCCVNEPYQYNHYLSSYSVTQPPLTFHPYSA
ncbi:uncharacterized protein BYT42DRAFT_347346 [Radiomyces spectabilis]|uniref:uncharacterized protein n=1 Tax=Radiomyces spectabilis TaxID=64574 RepID=UPI00221E7908|nr:uncharacterized protein BYT42DRAFT_347346 [Radiomyces spectabilis]KAI8377528.1 hypothetical protein BYT42DRAFT_347346 [Radiomyces spectabilis]